MKIEQFEDKGLAHFSYIIMSDAEIAVIDPTRTIKKYEEYAMLHDARLTTVIETHPHADFVSGHLELSDTKQANIYVSRHVAAEYPHTPFDEGDELKLGQLTLKALNTPGHSPDSISVLLLDKDGQPHALFSGDSLFIGDVGRPDLRENVGNETAARIEMASQMYHTTRQKLMTLPDHVLVYPAHGAGSLCGKALSEAKCSTIGQEKQTNPALQPMTEEEFITYITTDQPFVPKYFEYDVQLNRKGAPKFESSIKKVPVLTPDHVFEKENLIIDTRPQAQFKLGHLPKAINLQDGPKFETWLGSIIAPEEEFYLIAQDEETLKTLICRAASIGYERFICGALAAVPGTATHTLPKLDLAQFKAQPDQFTLLDIRNENEVTEQPIFAQALSIPLPQLRERVQEIPTDKPIVVHCAGGYRSAAGASIVSQTVKNVPVYDLGEAIKQFSK